MILPKLQMPKYPHQFCFYLFAGDSTVSCNSPYTPFLLLHCLSHCSKKTSLADGNAKAPVSHAPQGLSTNVAGPPLRWTPPPRDPHRWTPPPPRDLPPLDRSSAAPPNIWLFFLLFRHEVRSFSPAWGSSRGTVAAVQGQWPSQSARLGSLGSFCDTPAAGARTKKCVEKML